jgi:hypothetical protein
MKSGEKRYNSLLKNKWQLNHSRKSIFNQKTSKSCIIKNIFYSYNKNTNNYNYNDQFINIKSYNNSKNRRVSPQKVIKKRVIPKIRKNDCHSLIMKKNDKQLLKRNNRYRHKSTKPSTLGISVTATHYDTTNKDYSSFSNKKRKIIPILNLLIV